MSRALYALASVAFVSAAYLDCGEIRALMTAGVMLLAAAWFSLPAKRREDRSADIARLENELEKAHKREAETNLKLERAAK